MTTTPELSEQALLEHRAFVRSLARRLARDPEEAEELEQDAWVVALDRGTEAPERPRPWLARVVRNLAWTRRRGALRRSEHEARAETPERDDDPRVLAERMELAQRVVAAALELDEPQRAVVLLRHLRELDVDAIAARLGVPRETVRTRLRRAHARLRERLDHEHGGRVGWAPALLAYADLPLRELGTTAATSAALTTGGTIMITKMALVCVALVAAAAVWWSASSGDARGGRAGDDALVATSSGSSESEPATEAPSAVSSVLAERRAGAAPVGVGGWWLVGVLGGPQDDDRDTRVELATLDDAEPAISTRVAPRFELALNSLVAETPRLSALRVRVDHPDFLSVERWLELPDSLALAPGERRELTLELELAPAAGFVTGRVTAVGRTAPGGFTVALHELDAQGVPAGEPVEVTECADGGAFRLRAARAGRHALVAFARAFFTPQLTEPLAPLAPATTILELAGDGGEHVAPLEVGFGETIEGTLRDAEGGSRAGDSVNAEPVDQGATRTLDRRSLAWLDGRFVWPAVWTRTGNDGRFRLTGLAPLAYELEPGTPGHESPVDDPCMTGLSLVDERAVDETLRVDAPAVGVVLTRRAHRLLLELTCEGEPVESPRFTVTSPNGGMTSTSGGCVHGRFELAFAAGMEFELTASKPGFVPARLALPLGEPPPDGVLALELERGPTPAQLTLIVEPAVVEPGLHLDATLTPWPEGEPRPERTRISPARVHAFGDVSVVPRLEVGTVDAGRWLLRASPSRRGQDDSTSFALDAELVLELAPGESAVRTLALEAGGRLLVFVPEEVAEGARLRVEVRDAAGTSVRCSFRAPDEPHGAHRTALPSGPSLSRQTLTPGDYTLHLRDGGAVLRAPIAFTITPGEVAELRVD